MSAPTAAAAAELLAQLKAEFASSTADLNRCRSLLTQLKIELASLSLLVPDGSRVDVAELALAREVLELGAQWSIRARDISSFERYYAQLKVYYHDFANQLPESPNMYPIVGLNLLRLLAQKRIAEFHLILETIDPQVLRDNAHIRYPVVLEQSLMEGSYNRVLASRIEAPTPECNTFLEILEGTIRDEIASGIEKAYNSLSLNDAAQLLSIKNVQDLIAFANERDWKVNPSEKRVEFTTADSTADAVPTAAIVDQMLRYARELETIV
ncbi:SAC3/GANP/Nin1/mts3/eIF-3 p25 family-domain-containing protein [Thamnocephalis sphaerospora]|uniref:SAC3/GANP/Nin1/mts3/eIF-3 p25 family-domain-containing protein n=1 Tax=Thamnocephalis sphaerospora TaxID=78915 RepID=A0A4P9XWR2_9FUNG|nr:SAC3/GANP/Nin1/mts3/eIF-3 p25 family-domain-containing protein [Thamnocephalis sphaerospora]|eukprot:RKP10091.1 SAC3/GANP/Nin1/mts3/eIF-3 p25 family-domain-containing protein [Thamnocephalis sphaerospora]